MRTRTKGTTRTAAEAVEASIDVTSKFQLGQENAKSPQLVVLQKNITPEARIVSLTNPRYLSVDRYLICPEHGFFEFRLIAAPKTTPRSWLLAPHHPYDDGRILDTKVCLSNGYVTKAADLFVATPVDPLFFLLPALAPVSKGSEPAKRLFLSSDDYLERFSTTSPHFAVFMRNGKLRGSLERRMADVCDTVEAGDETMYRLDEEKLLLQLLQKAKKMVIRGLPSSMEDKLIRKALEVPMLSIKRGESSLLQMDEEDLSMNGHSTNLVESPDTQATVASSDSATSLFSEASTAATSSSESSSTELQHPKMTLPPIDAPVSVVELMRIRMAWDFICSNYIPPHITARLKNALSSTTATVDFSPLDTHLAQLAKLRQEALAARSLGDYSRKRAMNEDDEDIEIRAEKKRKKEEEEKRKKAGESLGVKKLKKVNVTGMKKMSDFFKKK